MVNGSADEPGRVFLLPGQYYVSRQPTVITTLLGSCVAVCLFNRTAGIGGMNHFMLPDSPPGKASGRYGDYAIRAIVEDMERNTGHLRGTEAMIFGGAAVIGTLNSKGPNIGDFNADLARRMLEYYNIPITKELIGGYQGLKIRFQTWDNRIRIRHIERQKVKETLLTDLLSKLS